MSSNAYDSPLRLEWRESRWFSRYTDGAHGLALLALILPLQLSAAIHIALFSLVIISWVWQRCSVQPRRRRQCSGQWIWFEHARWERHHGGHVETLYLKGTSVVLPWLVSLRLRDDQGRYRYLILLPPGVSKQTWRHLQIRLRDWGGTTARDQAPA
jgi:hypothetical protein